MLGKRLAQCAGMAVIGVLLGCGDASMRRGDEALARQDYNGAIEAFSAALAQNPQDVAIRYRLVDAYVKRINVARSLGPLPLVDLERAVTEVHAIIEPVKDTEPDLLAALVQLHLSLARNYDDAQRPQEAREEWQIIAELQPGAMAHYNIGTASMLLGDWEGAIAEFQRALELDEFLADAYKGVGNAYIQLRQDAQAVEAYRQALAVEPLDSGTRYNLGIALKRTGELEEAITEFQKVIDDDPTYALAYRGMRDTYDKKGDREAALEWDKRFREVAGIGEPDTAASEPGAETEVEAS